ncbi:translation elongation factor P [Olsenella sp. DNF00959]|nr:translation elongation factor P [Olsenella sp. DNF00959]
MTKSPRLALAGAGEKERHVATISTADFKNGMGLKINGKYYTLVEFQHVKPGKGGAFVRYTIKDLKSGKTINNQTVNAGTKFESVQLITREMQYLYNDGVAYVFMDNESYEQIPVDPSYIGDNAQWLKENDTCQLLYADTELLGVNPPMFIEVEITETDPGFKGDTVQGGTKPATIETGATIQVPMYLNQGEVIKVDTRDGKFVSRV